MLLTTGYFSPPTEDRAPDQPSTMAAIVKANSIEVNWGAPNSDIRVRQYILGYGRNIPDVYKKTFTSQQRRYVISNLSELPQVSSGREGRGGGRRHRKFGEVKR